VSFLSNLCRRYCDCKTETQTILTQLVQMEYNIMSKISEFAAREHARHEKLATAIAGLTEDVRIMAEQIETLQNTPGPISAEDQSTLDALEARSEAAVEKLEALDAANPKPAEPLPPSGPTP
jgi:hypothetical protein